MEEPKSIRDVQKLTGRIAALNRFIPRSADRSLPFFKVLRSSQKFEWGEQQREAFNSLKEYLQNITKLTSLDPKEILLLYTSASQKAVSAALVVERETGGTRKQYPVYFASEALARSKLHYSELEKIAYEVIMASRKLRHYFEAHRIIAISDQPLHDLLHNREASPRIAKWPSELSELVVDIEKRTSIKSQVLADFMVDWTSPEAQEEEPVETWTIHCDGAWQNEGVGIAAILESPSGAKIRYAARLNFDQSAPSTNNTTEYEALLLGLRKMKALGHQHCVIKAD